LTGASVVDASVEAAAVVDASVVDPLPDPLVDVLDPETEEEGELTVPLTVDVDPETEEEVVAGGGT
jgi:hypothetical protein